MALCVWLLRSELGALYARIFMCGIAKPTPNLHRQQFFRVLTSAALRFNLTVYALTKHTCLNLKFNKNNACLEVLPFIECAASTFDNECFGICRFADYAATSRINSPCFSSSPLRNFSYGDCPPPLGCSPSWRICPLPWGSSSHDFDPPTEKSIRSLHISSSPIPSSETRFPCISPSPLHHPQATSNHGCPPPHHYAVTSSSGDEQNSFCVFIPVGNGGSGSRKGTQWCCTFSEVSIFTG